MLGKCSAVSIVTVSVDPLEFCSELSCNYLIREQSHSGWKTMDCDHYGKHKIINSPSKITWNQELCYGLNLLPLLGIHMLKP